MIYLMLGEAAFVLSWGVYWSIFWTMGGFSVCVVGLIYTIVRNFKKDFNDKFVLMEERIFQLAMGKSFKEILKEEKRQRKRRN